MTEAYETWASLTASTRMTVDDAYTARVEEREAEHVTADLALSDHVAALEADARRWRLVRRCTICGTPLDEPNRPWSVDCGGDCLACMADCGDPDAIEALKPYVPKRREKPDAQP